MIKKKRFSHQGLPALNAEEDFLSEAPDLLAVQINIKFLTGFLLFDLLQALLDPKLEKIKFMMKNVRRKFVLIFP